MHKKIFLSLAIVLFTSLGFAQDNDTYTQDVLKLMESRNGMSPYKNLNRYSNKLSEVNAGKFISEMNVAKEASIATATQKIKDTYSHQEVLDIYAEFNSDTVEYSDKTMDFLNLWKTQKGLFSKEIKRLFNKYNE